ncbi:MAG TPA: ABC transporter substrate-binding protein [Xanthobacteraceae bacterium]|nr:ABC transporter substrate-binding protein [Xanthobacteraceae bacterium]
MERREFIKLVCSLVGAWPIAAYAQQVGKPRRIGVLGADATVWRPWTAAFVAHLRELGWAEGDNFTIEYRWSEGSSQRVSEIAAEFLRRDIDVIVTYGGAVTILKQATTTIPIVFAVAIDPVRSGLVQSLERPGGNVTGMSIQQPDLVGKRLEVLRKAIPQLHRLAILADAGYAEPMLEADRVKSMAQAMGLEAARLGIWGAQDIASAFEALRKKADALYVVSDALIAANRARIIRLALSAHLPTILSYDDYVEAGGLISYGPSYTDLFRRAADMVDKILHGTKPGDIPVEQPTKFDFAINIKTATALGLTIPSTLLATADEIIK